MIADSDGTGYSVNYGSTDWGSYYDSAGDQYSDDTESDGSTTTTDSTDTNDSDLAEQSDGYGGSLEDSGYTVDDGDATDDTSNTTDASDYEYDDPRTDSEHVYMPDEQTPDDWAYNPNDDGTVTDVHDVVPGTVMTPEEFANRYNVMEPINAVKDTLEEWVPSFDGDTDGLMRYGLLAVAAVAAVASASGGSD